MISHTPIFHGQVHVNNGQSKHRRILAKNFSTWCILIDSSRLKSWSSGISIRKFARGGRGGGDVFSCYFAGALLVLCDFGGAVCGVF